MWQQLSAYYWAVDYCSGSAAHRSGPPKTSADLMAQTDQYFYFLERDVKHN